MSHEAPKSAAAASLAAKSTPPAQARKASDARSTRPPRGRATCAAEARSLPPVARAAAPARPACTAVAATPQERPSRKRPGKSRGRRGSKEERRMRLQDRRSRREESWRPSLASSLEPRVDASRLPVSPPIGRAC